MNNDLNHNKFVTNVLRVAHNPTVISRNKKASDSLESEAFL